VVSEKTWTNLSTAQKIDTLHEEIKNTQSNTRLLKKIVTGVVSRMNEIRRYLGMQSAA
jgi:hypothetical protein